MKGTFREGDVLFVSHVNLDVLEPGDVIAFTLPGLEDETLIAHRIRTKKCETIITQGDANLQSDIVPVEAQNILGRVDFLIRGRNTKRVFGGQIGRIIFRLLRLRLWFKSLMRGMYQLVRASGIISVFLKPRIQRVDVVKEGSLYIKYVYRSRTVACWWPDRNHFWCRKPFDLFVPTIHYDSLPVDVIDVKRD